MGEVAGVILWGRALGKKAFRQGDPGDQQGERPAPGGPGLGLRQAQLSAQAPHGGSVGSICPSQNQRSPRPTPGGQPGIPPAEPRPWSPLPSVSVPEAPSHGVAGFSLLCADGGGGPHQGCSQGGCPGLEVCVQGSGNKGSGLRRDTGGDLRAGPGCSPSWGSQVRSAGQVGWPQPEALGRGCMYPSRGAGSLGCSPP